MRTGEPAAGGLLLRRVLPTRYQREVLGREFDVLPLRAGAAFAQGGESPLAELPSVLGDIARTGPHTAARPVVLGERQREGGGAGGLGAEHHDAAGERGPDGRGEEVPAADRVRPDVGARHGVQRAAGVHEDGHGAETAGEFVPVRLRGEDRVHGLGDGRAEDRHVRVPDGGVAQIHPVVVDGAHDPDVRVDLAHPGDAVGERHRLDGGGADEHREPFAAGLRGPYEVVVARVRRIELAEDQAVFVSRAHAATSSGVAGLPPRSRDQLRSPMTHRVRKPTYRIDVRYRSLCA